MKLKRAFKSLISAFTVIVICLLSVSVNALELNVSENKTEAQKAYDFLKAVGALDSEEVEFNASMEITRAHFVKLALHLSNDAPTVLVSNDEVFEDVTPDTKYEIYIEAAYRIGYISGLNNRIFDPETPITLIQALKILSNVLGYEEFAQVSGGFPQGYMTVASDLDLLDGVSLDNDQVLDMANAMIMLRNAAHADVMFVTSSGANLNKDAYDGVTVLTKKHKVEKVKGVVQANTYTDLYSQEPDMQKGKIRIGAMEFTANETDAEDYLGYEVELYYDNSENQTDYNVLYIELTDKNNITTVSADCDIEVNKKIITYYDEDNKSERLEISDGASFILNGKMAIMAPEEILNIEKGIITFVSNDGDSDIDVVLIKKYETMVAASVSAAAGIIIAKDGSRLYLEEDNNDYTFSISKNSKDVSISAIEEKDVILVAESVGAGLCHKEIIVSNEHLNASFESIGSDYAAIQGESYDIDAGVLQNVKVGVECYIGFDALGNISYVDSANSYVYGYLQNIVKTDLDEPRCRIFTENNRWVDLDFNNKVEYNGETIKAQELYNTLTALGNGYRQLVRYNVNSEAKLIKLWTAQNIPIGSSAESEAIEDDTFRASFTGTLSYRNSIGSFNGKFFADNMMKIFVIPADNEKDKFRIIKKNQLVDNSSYDITAYDIDEYLNCTVATVDSNIAKAINHSDKFMLVMNKGMMLNHEGEVVPSITGYWRDMEISFPVDISENGVSSEVVNGLSKGDVILFTYDDNSNINYIKLYALDNGYFTTTNVYQGHVVMAGRVSACDTVNCKIRFEYSPTGDEASIDYTTSTTFYMYDKGEGAYKLSSAEEILPEDTVYVNTRYLRCYDILIIRD